jgi:hypothetical protein
LIVNVYCDNKYHETPEIPGRAIKHGYDDMLRDNQKSFNVLQCSKIKLGFLQLTIGENHHP